MRFFLFELFKFATLAVVQEKLDAVFRGYFQLENI